MFADTIDALDRRYRYAEKACSAAKDQILSEVYAFARFLEEDPWLAAAYEDIRIEAAEKIARFRERDDAIAQMLRPICDRIAVADPAQGAATDDEAELRVQTDIASFDSTFTSHGGLRLSFFPGDVDVDSKSEALYRLLQARHEAGQERMDQATSRELMKDLWNAHQLVEHLRHEWVLFSRSDQRVAGLRLQSLAESRDKGTRYFIAACAGTKPSRTAF